MRAQCIEGLLFVPLCASRMQLCAGTTGLVPHPTLSACLRYTRTASRYDAAPSTLASDRACACEQRIICHKMLESACVSFMVEFRKHCLGASPSRALRTRRSHTSRARSHSPVRVQRVTSLLCG